MLLVAAVLHILDTLSSGLDFDSISIWKHRFAFVRPRRRNQSVVYGTRPACFALFFFIFFAFLVSQLVVVAASLAGHKKLLTATIARVGWKKICSNDYICLLHGGAKAKARPKANESVAVRVQVQVPSYDWVLMSWEKCIKENQFPESQLDKWVYSCHKRELQESAARSPNKEGRFGIESNRTGWMGVGKWKSFPPNGLTNV